MAAGIFDSSPIERKLQFCCWRHLSQFGKKWENLEKVSKIMGRLEHPKLQVLLPTKYNLKIVICVHCYHWSGLYGVPKIFDFSRWIPDFKIKLLCYAKLACFSSVSLSLCTVSPLLSAVPGRTKLWSEKPRLNEVCGW